MEAPEERIWILLSRKFSNSITEAEDAELKQLLRHHPDAHYTFDILGKIWKIPASENENPGLDSFFDRPDEEKATAEFINGNLGAPKHFRMNLPVAIMVAASILLIAGASFFVFQNRLPLKSKTEVANIHTISTKAGEKKQLILPDGTKIWLNAVSRLSYSAGFTTDSIRSVTLTGEAYFKVKHDENHPFIVHTKNMDITDLGTAFNVRSYPGEALTEATLISGIIEVTIQDNTDKKIRLKPKEKIVVYQNKHFEKYSHTDSLKKAAPVQDIQVSGYSVAPIRLDSAIRAFPEISWLQNEMVFKNELFEDLARTMERKYAMKIVITGNQVKQYRLTGVFRDETIEQALMELQVIAPFKYRIKDSVVTIY